MRTMPLFLTINWRWKKNKCIWKTKWVARLILSRKEFFQMLSFSGSYFPLLYSNSSPEAPFLERIVNLKMLFLTYRRSKGTMHPWKCNSHLDTGVCFYATIPNVDLSALWSKAVSISALRGWSTYLEKGQAAILCLSLWKSWWFQPI